MQIVVNPHFTSLQKDIETILEPDYFNSHGELLYDGRNTLKRFKIDNMHIVVKRYGHISLLNRFVYGFIRKSKAERAYANAHRLRSLNIATPEEIAYAEIRNKGLLNTCYFISAYTDYHCIAYITEHFTEQPDLSILDALCAFLHKIHNAGVIHNDLNIGNILYKQDCSGNTHFQLIDINRMKFIEKPLSRSQRLDNLRKLSCNTAAYLYILECYSHYFQAAPNQIELEGLLRRIVFETRQQLKRTLKTRLKTFL